MDEQLLPGDELLADHNALKLVVGSLLDRILVGDADRKAKIGELCDFALRSVDGFKWRDVSSDRAEMLSEAVRFRVTEFFASLMNPLADPKARH